ncbi:intracellular chloride channel [Aureococcus anophagefferens]|uniref:Intracellular chloride channel n=1 Tax=Aureococcus anophagefferens TaxID=44056 RepID=A0ABR1FMS3_AURAN
MSATRPMNNVIGVTKTTRVRRPRTSSTKGSFGAADRFAPLPQREAYRGAVELGFPEKLQRLDTPGATCAFSGAAGSLEEGRAPLERRRAASTTNLERRRAAYVAAVRPERIREAKERKREAKRARDVLRLYHRDPYARSYPTIAIDGDDRPCTAPDAIVHTNFTRQPAGDTHMRTSHRFFLRSKYEAPRVLD